MKVCKHTINEQAASDMRQGQITLGDVAVVLAYGAREVRDGTQVISWRENALPALNKSMAKRLSGLTVVVAGNCVVNVYRRHQEPDGERLETV